MQVVEHCSELDAAVEHFLYSKRSIFPLAQVGFERFTCKKVHHEIPALVFDKVIVDARQVGMDQARQEKHFAPAGFNQRYSLWRVRVIFPYFLERYQAVAEPGVLRFVHGAHLACTQHLQNTIALLHDDLGEEQAGERIRGGAGSSCGSGEQLVTGKATRGLWRISRATRLAIHGGRDMDVYIALHTCTVPSSLPEAISCPSGDHVTDVTGPEWPR